MEALLAAGQIVMHPHVVGEVALGNLKNRTGLLADLGRLPHAAVADDDEVLGFIGNHALFGSGIGYVDAHLLASTLIGPDVRLWTRDRRLQDVAARLGCAC